MGWKVKMGGQPMAAWRGSIYRRRRGSRQLHVRRCAVLAALLFFIFSLFFVWSREGRRGTETVNRAAGTTMSGIRGHTHSPLRRQQGSRVMEDRADFIRGREEKVPPELLVRGRQNEFVDRILDTIDCQALASERVRENGDDDCGVSQRTMWRLNLLVAHHRQLDHVGGKAGGEQRETLHGETHPIVELVPPASCVSYFPEELLQAEEDGGHKQLQRVKGVVTREKHPQLEEEDVVVWRVSPSAPSTLRCVFGRNASDSAAFTTPVLRRSHLIWNSSGFLVHITMDGNLTRPNSDALGFTFSFDAESQVRFYGLPSRATGLQVPNNMSYCAFNQFQPRRELSPETALGGTVPLVHAVGRVPEPSESGRSTKWRRRVVGILWLNGSPLRVHTNSTDHTRRTSISFASTSGATRIYLLPGPTPEDVLFQYYSLTGFPMMPPLFSLGYHHAHQGHMNASSLLQLSATFVQEKIPVDTLSLCLHHTKGGRIFTWDETLFPDPIQLQERLWRNGGQFLLLSTVPYVQVDSHFPVYLEGKKYDFFVSVDAETEEHYIGQGVTGRSVWIDFLNSKARQWYGGLMKYKRFVGSTNHTFFSLEANQPLVSDDSGRHAGARETLPMTTGHVASVPHEQVHNLYGMLHAMAAYHGQLRRTHYHRRPFVITESFFSGTQRYAAVRLRLGRSAASWNHLRASVEVCLMHSIAGIPFVGDDVGGFFTNPDDELLVRWYQLAVFFPLFRSDASAESPFREVWHRPAHVRARIRDAIRFRYTLLPYLYTLFWHAHLHGELILRPLFFVYHHDSDKSDPVDLAPEMQMQQFLLGPHLFVAPVVAPAGTGDAAYALQMPPEDLHNFWTGELVPQGRTLWLSRQMSASLHSEEDIVPLFQRVGTIVPTLSNVDGMRSTHDAANYTLTIALPLLLPKLLPQEGRKGGGGGVMVNDTEVLAQGEMFLDGGSRYVSYHHSNASLHASCFIAFECALMPNESTLVLRWRTPLSSSSACREVVDELQGSTVRMPNSKAFLLTRLRLLFATPEESRHLKSAWRMKDARREDFVLSRGTDYMVEVLGLAVPLPTLYENTSNERMEDNDGRGDGGGGGRGFGKGHNIPQQLVAALHFTR